MSNYDCVQQVNLVYKMLLFYNKSIGNQKSSFTHPPPTDSRPKVPSTRWRNPPDDSGSQIQFCSFNITNISSILPMYAPENHTVEWLHIKNSIEDLKAQSNVSLNVQWHTSVHTAVYYASYIVISSGAVYIIVRLQRRARQAEVNPPLAVAFRAVPVDALVEAPKAHRQRQDHRVLN